MDAEENAQPLIQMQEGNITGPYGTCAMVDVWDGMKGSDVRHMHKAANGEPDMPSFLRCAAIIGTIAFLSPVHERAPRLPELSDGLDLSVALKTLETARSAGQSFAALDPETRARLLAHVASAARSSEASEPARKPARP